MKAQANLRRVVNDQAYAAEVDVEAPRDRVFAALTTLDGLAGWWASTVGGSTAIGADLVLGFQGVDEEIVLRVDVATRPSSVAWTCRLHSGLPEWRNTRIAFDLTERPDHTTLLSFQHVGLIPRLECYADCEIGWDHFLHSLAAYVETGSGMPFGA